MPSVFASQMPTDTVQQDQVQNNKVENIIKVIIKQLEKISVIWEDIWLDINNEMIKTNNKQELLEKIKPIRQFVEQAKNNDFIGVDTSALLTAADTVDQLIQHINLHLANQFSTVTPFNHVTRTIVPHENVTAEDIIKKNEENERALILVSKNAQTIGLRWYNKLYRTFDSYVVQPISKYNVPAITGIAGLTAAAGLYLWYHSQTDNKLMREILGYPPRFLAGALHLEFHEEHPLKWLGQSEKWLYEKTNGQLPYLPFITPILTGAYLSLGQTVKNAIVKKANQVVSKLKGGEYKLKSQGVTKWDVKINFNDLIGCEHAKNTCAPLLQYFENIDYYARKKITPEKGIFLFGEPGTGKTEFARAFCGEIKERAQKTGSQFNFYEVSVSSIITHESQGGIGGIGNLFALASHLAPCVIFIDEIDLLNAQRVGDKTLLSEFLSSMSGFMETDPKKQVIIMAATNKPENIDIALRRKGRFGTSLYFDYPTLANRKEYLSRRLSEISVDLDSFNIDQLALETDHCTYEDLNAVIKEAFRKAKERGVTLSQEILEESLDEEIRSIIKTTDKELSDKELAIIASHQTGTALMHYLLNTDDQVSKITIQPINVKLKEESPWAQYYKTEEQKQKPIIYGKVFTYKEQDTLKLDTKEEKIEQCKVLLAGTIAQEVLLGTSSASYHSEDKKIAFEIIKSIVFDGLRPDQLPKEVKNQKLNEVYALLNTITAQVKELLEQHKQHLNTLSMLLLQAKTLSGEQFLGSLLTIDRLVKNQLTPEEQEMLKQIQAAQQGATSQEVEQSLGLQEQAA